MKVKISITSTMETIGDDVDQETFDAMKENDFEKLKVAYLECAKDGGLEDIVIISVSVEKVEE